MEWDSYCRAVEAAWAKHKPRAWALMLTPWPWAGRRTARAMAEGMAAVVAEIEHIGPPTENADAVELHFLTPLRTTRAALADAAREVPLRMSFVDAVMTLQQQAPLFPNDADHNWVLDHGLPLMWLPKTEAWERRG